MFPTPAQRDLAGFATKLAAYGETPRYWRINRFEAFYNGQQYDGRPSFWDNAYPLRERAPAVQTGFARAAVNRLATLVFGDRSFPRLTVGNRVLRAALSDAERKALQALVDEVATALVLSHRMRQVLVEGLKCGSACVVTGLVDGAPAVEILPSKWCTPTLRRDGSVESVVVQWKHPDETGANKWAWHRREITAAHDRVYEPVPFREGREPEWAGVPFVDAPLRFCPVVWVRNLRPATAGAADVDGCSLIDGMEDEVEALDLELSQLYRNALYNGEPQMVKIGGAPASPAADGRQARDGSAPMGAMGSIAKWFVSGEGGGAGIVGVEHGAVGLRLVGEDPRLGQDVAVDGALDALSGLTSQPNLGSIVAALAGSPRDPGLDHDKLQALSLALDLNDVPHIRKQLKDLVPGYQPEGDVVDWVWMENEKLAMV